MVKVFVVFGDKNHKWVEDIEVPSRKEAAAEARRLAEKWNSSLRPNEIERLFWCVIPERPSRPKKKKEKLQGLSTFDPPKEPYV